MMRLRQMVGEALDDGGLRLYDALPGDEGHMLLGDVRQNEDGFCIFAPAAGVELRPKQLIALGHYIGERNQALPEE